MPVAASLIDVTVAFGTAVAARATPAAHRLPLSASIAEALHDGGYFCNDIVGNNTATLTKDSVTCEHSGDVVSVNIYADAETFKQVVAMAKQFDEPLVHGDKWAVIPPTKGAVKQVQEILGGETV